MCSLIDPVELGIYARSGKLPESAKLRTFRSIMNDVRLKISQLFQ